MKKPFVLFCLIPFLVGLGNRPAWADAPMVKRSAPGFYRVMLGDFEVTALSDGTVSLPVEQLLTNTELSKTQAALKQHHLSHPVTTSVNAYLINTGSKLVLIDAGAGALFGASLGRLLSNLRASGYAPEQVDEIYITHMHGDHIGGLLAGEQATFPNALVRADQADVDHWLSQENLNRAAPDAKRRFAQAIKVFQAYQTQKRFKAIQNDGELVPGISAIATHGHTPGHRIYLVESQGKKLVLWGDLMHVAAVQFADPSVTISFDSDSKAAMLQRQKAYAQAVEHGYLIGATHLSFPGMGYLRREGDAYVWIPINYSTVD